MDAKEFRKHVIGGGYAYRETIADYCALHDAPYSEEDVVAITRLQDYRDSRDPASPFFDRKRNEVDLC